MLKSYGFCAPVTARRAPPLMGSAVLIFEEHFLTPKNEKPPIFTGGRCAMSFRHGAQMDFGGWTVAYAAASRMYATANASRRTKTHTPNTRHKARYKLRTVLSMDLAASNVSRWCLTIAVRRSNCLFGVFVNSKSPRPLACLPLCAAVRTGRCATGGSWWIVCGSHLRRE